MASGSEEERVNLWLQSQVEGPESDVEVGGSGSGSASWPASDKRPTRDEESGASERTVRRRKSFGSVYGSPAGVPRLLTPDSQNSLVENDARRKSGANFPLLLTTSNGSNEEALSQRDSCADRTPRETSASQASNSHWRESSFTIIQLRKVTPGTTSNIGVVVLDMGRKRSYGRRELLVADETMSYLQVQLPERWVESQKVVPGHLLLLCSATFRESRGYPIQGYVYREEDCIVMRKGGIAVGRGNEEGKEKKTRKDDAALGARVGTHAVHVELYFENLQKIVQQRFPSLMSALRFKVATKKRPYKVAHFEMLSRVLRPSHKDCLVNVRVTVQNIVVINKSDFKFVSLVAKEALDPRTLASQVDSIGNEPDATPDESGTNVIVKLWGYLAEPSQVKSMQQEFQKKDLAVDLVRFKVVYDHFSDRYILSSQYGSRIVGASKERKTESVSANYNFGKALRAKPYASLGRWYNSGFKNGFARVLCHIVDFQFSHPLGGARLMCTDCNVEVEKSDSMGMVICSKCSSSGKDPLFKLSKSRKENSSKRAGFSSLVQVVSEMAELFSLIKEDNSKIMYKFVPFKISLADTFADRGLFEVHVDQEAHASEFLFGLPVAALADPEFVKLLKETFTCMDNDKLYIGLKAKLMRDENGQILSTSETPKFVSLDLATFS